LLVVFIKIKKPVNIPLFSKNPDKQDLEDLSFVANFPRPENGIPRRVTRGLFLTVKTLHKV
jgi:hypothetical protein